MPESLYVHSTNKMVEATGLPFKNNLGDTPDSSNNNLSSQSIPNSEMAVPIASTTEQNNNLDKIPLPEKNQTTVLPLSQRKPDVLDTTSELIGPAPETL